MTKQKETKIRVKDDVTAATGEKCSKYAFIYVAGRRLVDAAAVDGSAAGNDCIKECIDADVSYSKYALHKSPSLQPVPCNGVTLIDGETCTMHRHAMKPIGTTPSVKDEHSAYAHRLCLDCEWALHTHHPTPYITAHFKCDTTVFTGNVHVDRSLVNETLVLKKRSSTTIDGCLTVCVQHSSCLVRARTDHWYAWV
jgi:hypothetical protein